MTCRLIKFLIPFLRLEDKPSKLVNALLLTCRDEDKDIRCLAWEALIALKPPYLNLLLPSQDLMDTALMRIQGSESLRNITYKNIPYYLRCLSFSPQQLDSLMTALLKQLGKETNIEPEISLYEAFQALIPHVTLSEDQAKALMTTLINRSFDSDSNLYPAVLSALKAVFPKVPDTLSDSFVEIFVNQLNLKSFNCNSAEILNLIINRKQFTRPQPNELNALGLDLLKLFSFDFEAEEQLELAKEESCALGFHPC
jgi:hypothetical protein